MRVAVIGAGFVGVTTAVALAESGHEVRLVETQPGRRDTLRSGAVPFHEEGLGPAYRDAFQCGRIRVGAHLDTSAPPEVVYITVGTPQGVDGSADLGQVEAAARDIGQYLRTTGTHTVVAVKSTVPPGTTRNVVLPAVAEEAGPEASFGVAATPEFLREGQALQDARAPSRIVIGVLDPDTEAVMRRLHAGTKSPLVSVGPEAAEMIKYASNALLATKVAFANEMGNLAERLGLDIDEVMAGVGMDPRLSPHFLQAGLGFGGSCFPKDVAALQALARDMDVPSMLLDTVLRHNEHQPLRAVDLARELLGTLDGRRVALLGLAFKPGTSDVRESRAIPIYHALRQAGAEVVCYDPVAMQTFQAALGADVTCAPSAEAALEGADAGILQTAWPEFSTLDPIQIHESMRTPVFIDGRRAVDLHAFRSAGIDAHAIGNGSGRYHESGDPSSRPWHKVPARDEERPERDAAPPRPTGHPVRR